jgi:hypothetical protein
MTAGSPRRRIEIVIGELVLHGVERADADTVATALREGLVGLGQSRAEGAAAAPTDRAESFRRLPPVVTPAGSPGALGRAVAGAVIDSVWEAPR